MTYMYVVFRKKPSDELYSNWLELCLELGNNFRNFDTDQQRRDLGDMSFWLVVDHRDRYIQIQHLESNIGPRRYYYRGSRDRRRQMGDTQKRDDDRLENSLQDTEWVQGFHRNQCCSMYHHTHTVHLKLLRKLRTVIILPGQVSSRQSGSTVAPISVTKSSRIVSSWSTCPLPSPEPSLIWLTLTLPTANSWPILTVHS